jgi:hypothetical protein
MSTRIIAIILGIGAVAVLSVLVSQSRNGAILKSRPGAPAETQSPTNTKPNCERSKQENQAGEIISTFDRLTYGDYAIQTRYKIAKLDVPREYGPPPKPVRASYIVVRHGGKLIARFDDDIYSPLGNSTEAGFFSLLHKSPSQLIISQDISRTGVQWVADFSIGFKIIFDGQKFQVGREAGDMTISDLDDDGTDEITVPITNFYGFESWRLSPSETPLPDIIFKYDPHHREYLPANPQFKECLLKKIEEADKNARALNEQPSLGRLMSITLDYVFVGEEQRGWRFFDETCKLQDKDRIKADMKKELKSHPVYRYVYSNLRSNERSPGIRAVDFANHSYPGAAVYTNRRTFTLKDGMYEGLLIPGCRGSASDCHEPVSLVAETYGDVTGDSIEEAMVVLTESIRGSAIPYYVYVFAMEKGRPKLLWAVATGDRAEGGLRKVYAEKDDLVIELYGKGARVNGNVFAGDGNGACCPLSVTRTRYRWNGKHFVQHGQSEVFSSGGNGAPLEMEIQKPD